MLHARQRPLTFKFLSVTAVMQLAIATQLGTALVSNWNDGRQAAQLPVESNALQFVGRLLLYLVAPRAAVRSACGGAESAF